MRTIRLLTILFYSFMVGTLSAQPTNNLVQDVVLQPPNAASLGKYGDVPINYSVGLPNISIPLETVEDGSISLPISLSYHPSGHRVSEMASWVGMGFTLHSGGMISRTVLGIPDLSVNGYFNSGGNVSTDPNDICNIGTSNLDGEPDIFHFSFAGQSGKFFFGSNQEIYVISEETDLKIGYELSGSADFASFTITTPGGTRYFFGKDPYTQVTAYEQMQAGNNATNWRNSWMLLRIESFDAKNTIQLSYTPETYNYKSPASCRYVNAAGPHETTGVSCPGSNGDNLIAGYKYNHIIQYVTTQRLIQIASPTKTVNFIGYVAREDLVGTSFRLEAIQSQSGTFCKRFNFSYDYFFDYLNHTNDNNHPWFKRLKLQQVAEISCDGTESKNAHVFEYAGPSQNGVSYMVNRLSKATDAWGFYNNQHGNDLLEVNVPATTLLHPNTGVLQTYGSALRDSDENFMDYGVLNKITYPTGGHTAFTFEGNTARITSLTDDKVYQINNLTTCGTPGIACCGPLEINHPQTISIDPSAKFDIELVANTAPLGPPNGCTDYNASATVQALDDMGFVVGEFGLTLNYQTEQLEFKQENGLPLTAIGNFTSGQSITFKLKSNNGKATFRLYTQGTEVNTEVVGGLRIQEIRHHDGSGNPANDIIKTFEYELADGSFTSGQLFYIPNYGSSIQLQDNAVYFYYTADAQVPLSGADGRHVMYSRVVERLKDNGKIVHEFFVDPEPSCQEIQVAEVSDAGLSLSYQTSVLAGLQSTQLYKSQHGKLRRRTTYNEAGEEIACTENRALPASYTYLSGLALKVKPYNCPATIDGHAYAYLVCNPRTGAYLVDSVARTVDGVTSISRYGYDEQRRGHLPVREEMTNSDGQTFITETAYPYHFTDAVYDSLVRQNRIALPIRTLQKVKENGGLVQTGGRFNHYGFFDPTSGLRTTLGNQLIYPYLFEDLEVTWDANGTTLITGPNAGWDTLGYIPSYDMTVGKPNSIQLKGWEPEAYTWNPINKKIATKTYKDFQWIYDYYANTSLLKESIDIDGQDTDYRYDKLMRLQQIIERDGNKITDIAYGYKGGSNLHNFIHQTTTYQPEGFNLSSLRVVEIKQYLDGLGRLEQTNQVKHSPDAASPKDVITAVAYDNQGRVRKTFEPFASNFSDGSFQAVPNGTPFTLTEYEASPMNRPVRVTPPAWYPTHTLYGKNEAAITIPGTSLTYAIGELSTITTIEPDGSGTQTGDRKILFSDKRGKPILIRRQNQSGSEQTNLFTTYDKKERESLIIPPGATANDAGLIFSYLYSGEDNVLELKIPDMEKIETLYDARNLPIAMRHGNLRADGKWMVTEYDEYGRPKKIGLNISPTTVQEIWVKNFWDGQSSSSFAGIKDIVIPKDQQQFVDEDGNDIAPPNPQSDPIYKGKIHYTETAILDGDVARPTRLLSINLYDEFGRVKQVDADNHLGGFDRIIPRYDFADNPVRATRFHYHTNPGFNLSFVTQDKNSFDHQGRKTLASHTISGIGTFSKDLCSLAYDIKDLVKTKFLGGLQSSGYLQQVDYTYQPNRFLKGINETMSATDLFSLQIGYDQGVPSLGAAAQYDRNIASLSWRFKGGVLQQYGYSYDEQNRVTAANYNLNNNAYGTTYGFDKRGNFTNITRRGVYSDGSSFTAQVIDNMGFTLQSGTNKLQTITDSAPCPTDKVVHQQLDNTELHATQQTITADNIVNDNADITFQAGTAITLKAGFHAKAGTNFTAKIEGCPQSGFETDGFVERSSASYQFDANGNRTFDPHLGISILYNYRNQPYRITFPNGNMIEWLRSGSGEKLQRLQKRNGNIIKKLDYFGSIEYENDTVATIYLENSKLTFENGVKSDYQYFLKNHLMSTQVVFKDDGNGVAEVVSQHQQYPFGYPMKGDFTTNFKTKRLYNFKEAISDFGLGWMDFGARYYTSGDVPVFIGVDPIASSFPYVSPFNYAENEPVRHIDLWGLQKYDPQTGTTGPFSNEYIAAQEEQQAYNQAAANTTQTLSEHYSPQTTEALLATGDLIGFTLNVMMTAEAGGQMLSGLGKSAALGPTLANLADDGLRALDDIATAGMNIEKGAWAQTTFSNSFSKTGQKILSESAGQSIKTIDDAVGALQSGKLSTGDLPIDVVVREGNTLMLNTRSSVTLTKAGIPRSQWNVVNRTGQELYENLLSGQLKRNNLTSTGTNTVRQSGTQTVFSN